MNFTRAFLKLAVALAFVSLIALVFSFLALTDIYHGEADTSLESTVVRSAALAHLLFIGVTIFALRKVMRSTT